MKILINKSNQDEDTVVDCYVHSADEGDESDGYDLCGEAADTVVDCNVDSADEGDESDGYDLCSEAAAKP